MSDLPEFSPGMRCHSCGRELWNAVLVITAQDRMPEWWHWNCAAVMGKMEGNGE